MEKMNHVFFRLTNKMFFYKKKYYYFLLKFKTYPLKILFNRIIVTFLLVPFTSFVTADDNYIGIGEEYFFPANETSLEHARSSDDIVTQREHMWKLWLAINKEAPSGGPIWETWFSADHVFRPESVREIIRNPSLKFEKPRQFIGLPSGGTEAVGQSQFASVLFNEEAHNFIRTEKLFLSSTLNNLNQSMTDSGIPISERDISHFPPDATVLKTVWLIAKANSRTPIPVWDFTPTQANQDGNPVSTWSRQVMVDTTGIYIPPDTIDGGRRVVSIEDFYSVEVTSTNVPRGANPGDKMILVALHVTTKEIKDWVWGTFWWHDKADLGPFAFNKNQKIKGVWRNYLMDVAFDSDLPREFDGSANAVMNPYLEAGFEMGLSSNCMTCHRKSAWPIQTFLPIEQGEISTSDPRFSNRLRLDFLWSLGMRAQ